MLKDEQATLQQRLVGIGAELNAIAGAIHDVHHALEKNKRQRKPYTVQLDKVLIRGKKLRTSNQEADNFMLEGDKQDATGNQLEDKISALQQETTQLSDKMVMLSRDPEHTPEDIEEIQSKLHTKMHAKIKLEATRNICHEAATSYRVAAEDVYAQSKEEAFVQKEMVVYLLAQLVGLLDKHKELAGKKAAQLSAGKLLDERANTFTEQQNDVNAEIEFETKKLEQVKTVMDKLGERLAELGLLDEVMEETEKEIAHSLYTHYTLTIHLLYTHYTLTIHSLYTHYTLTIHSLYTHYTPTIYTHYLHSPRYTPSRGKSDLA
jgi:chromosome segregation ATPase